MSNTKPDNSTKHVGIPRPFASTDLPRPEIMFQKIFSPLKVWQFVLIIASILFSGVGISSIYINGLKYSNWSFVLGLSMVFVALLASTRPINKIHPNIVPSISEVSKTTQYVSVASRIIIVSILAGIISLIVFLGIDIGSFSQSSINRTTRFAGFISLLFGYAFSYIIVISLFSYSALYENKFIEIPVKVSSLPEIVMFIGYVLPAMLGIYTGFFYNRPAFYEIPFSFTVLDTIILSIPLILLYIAITSRR